MQFERVGRDTAHRSSPAGCARSIQEACDHRVRRRLPRTRRQDEEYIPAVVNTMKSRTPIT
jgi:hypothetical protein